MVTSQDSGPRPAFALPPRTKREYYRALLDRRREYEGIFFVGVSTTGVFCRPTCPARKPKFENCEFFATAQQALLASYRPCKRCRPLSFPASESAVVRALIEAVEERPDRRWTERDFRELGIHSSTARRQFQRRFGMTFVAYARSRRMGNALKWIRGGGPVIDAQLDAGYESSSGFRDAFSRIMGEPPGHADGRVGLLRAAWIDTPLGPMIAIADEEALHLLEFVDRRGLEREIERLRVARKSAIVPGRTAPVDAVEAELNAYFGSGSKAFAVPLAFVGTPFGRTIWKLLREVPYGETWSYGELARRASRPRSVRAVARAVGMNQLALVVPCHRILRSDGELGGYAGGLRRKEWLIGHERAGST